MAFSCIDSSAADEFVDFTLAEHYSKMYSKCLIELAERALKRMKDDKGTILFISSPGCNMTQTPKPGYDMPGKLEKKCLMSNFFSISNKPTSFIGFGKSSGEFAIRYYAKNLQSRGINANTIIPGVVNTEAWNG